MESSLPRAVGKIPPQNIHAEQSTLGAMMIEKEALEIGVEMLVPDDFYRPTHQEVFDSLHALHARNEPCDLITLQEELLKRGKLEDCGGTEYLMALVDTVPTAANIRYHASIVEQKSLLRRLIGESTRMIELAMSGDEQPVADGGNGTAVELIEQAQQSLFKLSSRQSVSEIISLRDVCSRAYAKLPDIGDQSKGVPISLAPLREQCYKFFEGNLVIIAGRPGMGKSTVAFNLLMGAAKRDVPAAIFTLEMEPDEFAYREMAKQSGIPFKRMLGGSLNDEDFARIGNGMNRVWEYPLFFVNAAGWKMERIHNVTRRLVSQGVKIIAIDHLQRVTADRASAPRKEQLGQIARDAKNIAKAFRIPVLGLSQLTRDVDKRGPDARPVLADLKESGDIEAEADVVLMVWRDRSPKAEASTDPTLAEIIIEKNRMLPTGKALCMFDGRRYAFVPRQEFDYGAPPPDHRKTKTKGG